MATVLRVFLSSTFGDLARERTVLDSEVFPRIHVRCAEGGGAFRAVDLRWGISEAASRERRTMEVCLGEVRRCLAASPELSLILLLGDRYGWRPLPPQIDGDTFQTLVTAALPAADRKLLESAYKMDANALPHEHLLRPSDGDLDEPAVRDVLDRALGSAYAEDDPRHVRYAASATHLEVAEALTGDRAPNNVLVFARRRAALPPGTGQAVIEDRRRLDAFDAALVERLGASAVVRYSIADDASLEAFGEAVEEAVVRRSEQVVPSAPPLEATELCRDLSAQHTRITIGPDHVTQVLSQNLDDEAGTHLVVLAPPGGGKTTAVARALLADPGEVQVVGRLVGGTPEWTSRDALLRGMLTEINGPDAAPPPAAGLELERAFAQMLSTARERPLRIYLDGVDQLDTVDEAQPLLRFIPPTLAPGITLVLSATDVSDAATALRDLLPDEAFLALPALSPSEADTLLGLWLDDAGRTVQPAQRSVLLDRFAEQPLPLLLRLVTDQALRWRSYDEPLLGHAIDGVVRQGIDLLAGDADHGPLLVEAASAYLAAARFGLSDDEAMSVLEQDTVVMADLVDRSPHWPLSEVLPYVVWARLRADLGPYVSDRAVDGETVTAFGSPAVLTVVADLVAGRLTEAHAGLARLFSGSPSPRVLSERPFQLTRAGLWPDLSATLGDPVFVQAKCDAGRTDDLVDDYRRAKAAAYAAGLDGDDSLDAWSSFVLRQRASLEEYSHLAGFALQQIANDGPATQLPDTDSTWLRLDRTPGAASPLVTELPGHQKGATDCVFAPSGDVLYSAGMDGLVCAWSTRDWSLVDVVAELADSADSCDVSPDGTLVATACADGRIRIHDLRRRRVVVCEPAFERGPRRCRFSTDGATVFAVGAPGIATYDVATGALVRTGLSGEIVNDCTVLDTETALAGDCKGRVLLIDLATCEERRHVYLDQVRRVQGARVSPDGRMLVAAGGTFGSEDDMAPFGERDVLDTATWKQVKGHFERLDKPALNCTFIDEGSHYVVGLSDGALRVYSTDSGALVAAHKAHDKGVRGLAVSPDGRLLATAAYDGGVKVWDVSALTAPGSTSGGLGLFAVVDESGGGWAVTATVDNYSATFAVAAVPDSHTPPVLERPRWLDALTLDRRDPVLPMRTFSWEVPPVGARLAHLTSPATRAGKHWLVHSPSRMFPDAFHLLPVLDPSLWSSENVSWTQARDGTFLGLVRTRPEESEGQLQRRVELLTYLVEPWGLRPLVESAIGVPLGWQVSACGFTPTQRSLLVSLGPYVGDLTLLPGGQISAVGVEEDSQPKAEGHPEPSRSVRAFACSPNGTDIAAAYDDGLVRIFDHAAGALRVTTQAHLGSAVDCAYLDEQTLVTAGTDGTLRLWSAPDLELLAVFVADNAIAAFDLDAVSRRVLAVDAHGKARMLTVVNR